MRYPLLLLALAAVPSCRALPKAEVPMPATWVQDHGPEEARGLLVLLPGIGDRPEIWATRGILEIAVQELPGFDLVMPEAHYGYYQGGEVVERLDVDIVEPALAQGYERIWFLGVSLGGLGSAAYASFRPEVVDGIVMVAPYLGESDAAQSVYAAESLAAWDPDAVTNPDGRVQFFAGIWRWLQEATGEGVHGEGALTEDSCKLFLGYGDKDGPGTADERLADALPPERVFLRPGGHNWKVWNPMIRSMLAAVDSAVEQSESRERSAGGGGPVGSPDALSPIR